MKRLIIILFLTLGCSMSNEDIVEEINYCKSKGLGFKYAYCSCGSGKEDKVHSVICIPLIKKNKEKDKENIYKYLENQKKIINENKIMDEDKEISFEE